MRKLIAILFLLITFLYVKADVVSAEDFVAGSSAQLKKNTVDAKDYRVLVLKRFFNSYNSPLAEHAETFVEKADEYNLDWRLVPAISGVESTFGKRIPYNSYNAYGWANGTYRFNSWDHSIDVVSKTLREKYYDRGATNINSIARRYAPPSTTWAGNVKFFMRKIDPLPLTFTLEG